jgi:hypothetical protein
LGHLFYDYDTKLQEHKAFFGNEAVSSLDVEEDKKDLPAFSTRERNLYFGFL